ncbi:MAG TPA: hypothetical protein PK263_06615 [bacterium]|nr:hypothetical protein [bacterium]
MEENKNEQAVQPQTKKPTLWIVLAVIVVLLIAGGGYRHLKNRDNAKTTDAGTTSGSKTSEKTNSATADTTPAKTWQDGGVAIAGKYADSEIVDLGNGQYRMYYSAEPEIPNFKAQVYSAVSTDGITWTEEGELKQNATFPDLVKLPDGRWRMYFQNNRVIKSAVSADGRSFTDESGVRIDKTETGYTLDSVGSQSTIQLSDGTYLMVYSGTEEGKKYHENVPNNKIANFFFATSADGLTWQKQGLAVNSQNSTLEGFVDGAELVNFDGSTSLTTGEEIRLYFWGYRGIYYVSTKTVLFRLNPCLNLLEMLTQRPCTHPIRPATLVSSRWETDGICHTASTQKVSTMPN